MNGVAKDVASDIKYFTWVSIFVSSNLVGSDMNKNKDKEYIFEMLNENLSLKYPELSVKIIIIEVGCLENHRIWCSPDLKTLFN